MGLAPHDLIRIHNWEGLADRLPPLEWITESLREAPFVVIRRACAQNGQIPIGLRGRKRNERMAAYLSPSDIIERISPPQLAAGRMWRGARRLQEITAFQWLEEVNSFFHSLDIIWGPTGSIGYELVSGAAAVHVNSDLDLWFRAEHPLSIEQAQFVVNSLQSQIPIPIDVQMETPLGAVSLLEYALGRNTVLLRTLDGPKLVFNPWFHDATSGG